MTFTNDFINGFQLADNVSSKWKAESRQKEKDAQEELRYKQRINTQKIANEENTRRYDLGLKREDTALAESKRRYEQNRTDTNSYRQKQLNNTSRRTDSFLKSQRLSQEASQMEIDIAKKKQIREAAKAHLANLVKTDANGNFVGYEVNSMDDIKALATATQVNIEGLIKDPHQFVKDAESIQALADGAKPTKELLAAHDRVFSDHITAGVGEKVKRDVTVNGVNLKGGKVISKKSISPDTISNGDYVIPNKEIVVEKNGKRYTYKSASTIGGSTSQHDQIDIKPASLLRDKIRGVPVLLAFLNKDPTMLHRMEMIGKQAGIVANNKPSGKLNDRQKARIKTARDEIKSISGKLALMQQDGVKATDPKAIALADDLIAAQNALRDMTSSGYAPLSNSKIVKPTNIGSGANKATVLNPDKLLSKDAATKKVVNNAPRPLTPLPARVQQQTDQRLSGQLIKMGMDPEQISKMTTEQKINLISYSNR